MSMITIDEACNILTELKIQADPFTVRRWIREGQLRVAGTEHDDAAEDISEEALRRIIRRHFLDLYEESKRLRNERNVLTHERDELRHQLAQWQLASRQLDTHMDKR